MQWFEPIVIIVALLLVILPLLTYIAKKKKGTLKCDCGHPQSECVGQCSRDQHKKKQRLTYVIGIEGMKCGMCESHINDVIRRQFDVLHVKSSRKKENTVIVSNTLLNLRKIREVISNEGYQVTFITFE